MIKKLFLALTIVLISASPTWAEGWELPAWGKKFKFFTEPTMSENWRHTATHYDGTKTFIDVNSITKSVDGKKEYIYYWVIINLI